ncbi:MAG: flagellar hook assembly protein FlgD [Desulfuromonadia bacterium]
MVDPVAAVSGSAGAAAMKKATGFNKDDFLTLFITQMKNQDPLNPMDSTEFLGQLAQLTQVEQAYNTNANLEKLMKQQDASASLAAVTFIGRQIEAQSDTVYYGGDGQATISFSLPSPLRDGSLSILDGSGRVVKRLDLRNLPSGTSDIVWDGTTSEGTRAASGTYRVEISGTGSDGTSMTGTPLVRGVVEAVSLEGATPLLTVSSLSIPLTDVRNVRR